MPADHHGHGSAVVTATARHSRRLALTLVLTVGYSAIEVAAALWTGSLALLADAGHMLTDAGGLALAVFAAWLTTRPATPEKTYGYYRAEILAALANGVLLLGTAGYILVEAYRRLWSPPQVLGGPMLAVAAAGLAVNGLGMWLLREPARASLNIKGAYLELVGDAVGSLGAIAAAAIVLTTGWRLIDPLAAAGIGLFIVPRTWRLLRHTVDVLLEAAPPHVRLADVDTAMREVPGVRGVHDLHVWTLTSGKYAMSAHVLVDDLRRSDEVLGALHEVLHVRFDIEHTTIQPEPSPLLQIDRAGRSSAM